MNGRARLGVLVLALVPAAAAAQRGTVAASRESGAQQAAAGAPAAPAEVLPAVQFKVLIDLDYVSGEPQPQPPNLGFGIRRARLIAQLNPANGLGFRLHVDPTALTTGPQSAAPYRGVPLVEAYGDYLLPGGVLVRVGQQRVPYTLNAYTSGPALSLPEYDQLSRYTVQRSSAFRDVGVTMSGRRGALEYTVGVFNGAGINVVTDNDSTRDYAARVAYSVLPGVQLGGSLWRGHSGSPYVRAPGAAPVRAFFDDTDFHRGDVDLHLALGALDVAAEYGREQLSYNPAATNPTPGAAALARRGLNVAAAMRLFAVAPALRRWEVAGRYDRFVPDDSKASERMREVVAGVSYYLLEGTTAPDPRLGRAVNFVQRQSRVMAFWEWDGPEGVDGGMLAGAIPARHSQRFHARWELFY